MGLLSSTTKKASEEAFLREISNQSKLPRVLTAREQARILSVPDDFDLPQEWKKIMMREMQYIVPPLLAKAIGLALRVAVGDLKVDAALTL